MVPPDKVDLVPPESVQEAPEHVDLGPAAETEGKVETLAYEKQGDHEESLHLLTSPVRNRNDE